MNISKKDYTMIDAHLVLSLHDDSRSLHSGSFKFSDVTDLVGVMEDHDEVHFHHLSDGLVKLNRRGNDFIISGNNNDSFKYTIVDEKPDTHTWMRLMSMLSKDILRKYRYTNIELKSIKGE